MTKPNKYNWDKLFSEYNWVYDNIWFFCKAKDGDSYGKIISNHVSVTYHSSDDDPSRNWGWINAIGEYHWLEQIRELDVVASLADYIDRRKDPIRRSKEERLAALKADAYKKFEAAGVIE